MHMQGKGGGGELEGGRGIVYHHHHIDREIEGEILDLYYIVHISKVVERKLPGFME